MTQIPLSPASHLPVLPYDGAAPHRASDTSAAAAVAITPKIGRWQERVLLCLLENGPLSDEGIELVLDCAATRTSRPRRRELELAGYVEDSGGRVRAVLSGNSVTLWQLTPAGVVLAEAIRERASA